MAAAEDASANPINPSVALLIFAVRLFKPTPTFPSPSTEPTMDEKPTAVF